MQLPARGAFGLAKEEAPKSGKGQDVTGLSTVYPFIKDTSERTL